MRKLLPLIAIIVVTQPVLADEVELFWTYAKSDLGVTYKIYRAPCSVVPLQGVCPTTSEGLFFVMASGIIETIFDDPTILSANGYSYYVTAVCAKCNPVETPPSNHVAFFIPPLSLGTKPSPPSLSLRIQ